MANKPSRGNKTSSASYKPSKSSEGTKPSSGKSSVVPRVAGSIFGSAPKPSSSVTANKPSSASKPSSSVATNKPSGSVGSAVSRVAGSIFGSAPRPSSSVATNKPSGSSSPSKSSSAGNKQTDKDKDSRKAGQNLGGGIIPHPSVTFSRPVNAADSGKDKGRDGEKDKGKQDGAGTRLGSDTQKEGKDDGIKNTVTQAMQLMTAMSDQAAQQNRDNMSYAASLDERLSESNLTRSIRLAQATSAEQRFNIQEEGNQSRANILASGMQERETLATGGREQRATLAAGGEQERLTQAQRYSGETGLIRTTGEESRKGIETTGTQQRLTDLQQEMFRRYKENRDYEQAQRQYRV